MGSIITLITIIVIATSGGGAGTTDGGSGAGVGTPHSINNNEELQCNTPCSFDEETNTFICPC